jgi:hypothetical protein
MNFFAGLQKSDQLQSAPYKLRWLALRLILGVA